MTSANYAKQIANMKLELDSHLQSENMSAQDMDAVKTAVESILTVIASSDDIEKSITTQYEIERGEADNYEGQDRRYSCLLAHTRCQNREVNFAYNKVSAMLNMNAITETLYDCNENHTVRRHLFEPESLNRCVSTMQAIGSPSEDRNVSIEMTRMVVEREFPNLVENFSEGYKINRGSDFKSVKSVNEMMKLLKSSEETINEKMNMNLSNIKDVGKSKAISENGLIL